MINLQGRHCDLGRTDREHRSSDGRNGRPYSDLPGPNRDSGGVARGGGVFVTATPLCFLPLSVNSAGLARTFAHAPSGHVKSFGRRRIDASRTDSGAMSSVIPMTPTMSSRCMSPFLHNVLLIPARQSHVLGPGWPIGLYAPTLLRQVATRRALCTPYFLLLSPFQSPWV